MGSSSPDVDELEGEAWKEARWLSLRAVWDICSISECVSSKPERRWPRMSRRRSRLPTRTRSGLSLSEEVVTEEVVVAVMAEGDDMYMSSVLVALGDLLHSLPEC